MTGSALFFTTRKRPLPVESTQTMNRVDSNDRSSRLTFFPQLFGSMKSFAYFCSTITNSTKADMTTSEVPFIPQDRTYRTLKCDALIVGLIEWLKQDFLQKGGIKEQMYQARKDWQRRNGYTNSDTRRGGCGGYRGYSGPTTPTSPTPPTTPTSPTPPTPPTPPTTKK